MGFSTCWKCKTQFWMPDDLEATARASRGDIPVYCAYGHAGYFIKKSDIEIERDRLKQQIAQRDDELREKDNRINYLDGRREAAERSLTATKGVVTRIKNRVGHGVCPCCNRTFHDLQRHMASKHAGYAQDADSVAAE